ncbi:MAG TPA: hypothetical protein VER33_02695 [Polyangiaceae bacterium]|nr:hypothetical protein [Polyangiaceae bacterium]
MTRPRTWVTRALKVAMGVLGTVLLERVRTAAAPGVAVLGIPLLARAPSTAAPAGP